MAEGEKVPQEEGIKETMSGLLDSGVFELAEEDQDRYCANINIVAKPHKNIRNSKADKHVKKVSAESTPPAGWRACFDFRELNSITNENPKQDGCFLRANANF